MSGQSGSVAWPSYIMGTHSQMLFGETITTDEIAPTVTLNFDTNMMEIFQDAYAEGNPYASVEAYDPTSDLATVQTELTALKSVVTAIGEETTWTSMLEAVIADLGDIYPDTASDITADIAAFTTQEDLTLANATNRVAATYFDINAVTSTAFPASLAILESQHAANIASYTTQRRLSVNKERAQTILQAMSNMTNLLQLRMQGYTSIVQMQDGVVRNRIIAENDYTTLDADMAASGITWDLDLIDKAAGVMAAPTGVPSMTRGMTDKQQQQMEGLTIAGVGLSFLSSLMPLIPILF